MDARRKVNSEGRKLAKDDKSDSQDKTEKKAEPMGDDQGISPKVRKKRVINRDKKPVDPIFTVDVFEKARTDMPVKQAKVLNELRPVNTSVYTTPWEQDVLWDESEDDMDQSNDGDDDNEDDDDGDDKADKDANGAKKPKLEHSSLYLDLNDPMLVTAVAVKRPTVTRRVVMQQNRGRHRIPDWKLKNMATVLASKGPFASKDESGRHRFNISNDVFYQSRRGAQTNKNSWRSLLDPSHRATEAKPARDLRGEFFPMELGPELYAHFHRPRLSIHRGRAQLLSATSDVHRANRVANLRQERLREVSAAPFKTAGDFSALDDELLLAEYVEEHPLLVLQSTMCTNIRNYYRKLKPSDTTVPKLEYGTTVILTQREASPFLGDIARGKTFMSFENNLYRAPVFRHKPEITDFLVIRRDGRFYLRSVPSLFIVGQTMPKVEVPIPNSKASMEFISDRLRWITLKVLKKGKGFATIDEIHQFLRDESEQSIRKKLKDVAEYQRDGNTWKVKDDVDLDVESFEKILRPERYCAYLSMLAANHRLEAMRDYSQVYNPMADDEEDKQIKDEERLMPWNLTKNFIDCVRKECLLAITGPGAPTGNDLGFSYVRVANKPAHMRGSDAMVPSTKKEQTGKMSDQDRDLRKIPVKVAREMLHKKYGYSMEYLQSIDRWQVVSLVRNAATREASEKDEEMNYARDSRTTAAEHQRRFEADCYHVWDQQARDLGDTELRSSDDESDESGDEADDDDDDDVVGELQSTLQGKSTTKTAEQQEQDFVNFIKKPKKPDDATSVITSVTNMSTKAIPTQLIITRRVRNRHGEVVDREERVTDPRVIALYLHRRKAPPKKQKRRHKLLKQVSETKMSISQKGAYRYRRDDSERGRKGRRGGRAQREMDDDYSDFIHPTETVRVQRTGRNPEIALNTIIEGIIRTIMQQDTTGIFSKPVDRRKVADYYAIVMNPIDLGAMRERARDNNYQSIDAFREDLELMLSNCVLYNGPVSPYTSIAKRLVQVGTNEIDKQRERVEELSQKIQEMAV
eukprot:TRINITY_DN12063_c0_g1_i2.p1 TRINITY_DN12063_c0_g1~~TRINITY_DN12063_c0_g1_i2.p1  ORF type:complete len:1031 (+),score=278.66 TRINITY_DN12063_c0_g1_i2:380-3472(+)